MERPRIDAAARRAGHERLRDDLMEIRTRIADITVTADSPDGLVSATVVGRGQLSELRIDPRIYRTPDSKALAATIVDTVRSAVALAQAELFAVVRRFLPPGAELATSDVHTDPFLHQLEKEIERG